MLAGALRFVLAVDHVADVFFVLNDHEIKRFAETGEELVIKVHVGDIISGKQQDIPLMEGDVVYVNEKFF